MDHTSEISKLLKTNKLVYGTKSTMKSLKIGKLAKIYLTSNCPDDVRGDISHYSTMSKTEIIQLDIPNDELSQVCKKPFSISVLSVLKEKE